MNVFIAGSRPIRQGDACSIEGRRIGGLNLVDSTTVLVIILDAGELPFRRHVLMIEGSGDPRRLGENGRHAVGGPSRAIGASTFPGGRLMAAFPFATAERFHVADGEPGDGPALAVGPGRPRRGRRRVPRPPRPRGPGGLPAPAGSPDWPSSSTPALPRCPDPGMALTNLERFVAGSPTPESTLEALATNPRSGRDRRATVQHQPSSSAS